MSWQEKLLFVLMILWIVFTFGPLVLMAVTDWDIAMLAEISLFTLVGIPLLSGLAEVIIPNWPQSGYGP